MASKKKVPKGARVQSIPALDAVPEGYEDWLKELKRRVSTAQQKAVRSVNTELTRLYWSIGRDIQERQRGSNWGDRVISRIALDLRTEFPDLKGFSRSNLK